MIEFHEAGPGDAQALGEIHAASWAVAYAPFFDAEFAARCVAVRRRRWPERIAEGDATILFAAVDGRPLALSYATPSATRHRFAEIHTFYGHPDGWGTGVAAALMAHTLDRLRADGFTDVHLWTLRDTPQSRRFYVKCGFVETGAVGSHDFGDGNPLAQVEYEHALNQDRPRAR